MRARWRHGSSFYSLHRETYSVTTSYERADRTRVRVFLFAASRDVQRDAQSCQSPSRQRFYSLHRETYSVTTGVRVEGWLDPFLFAASRDVQRDRRSCGRCSAPLCFYSLHRETYSVTARHSPRDRRATKFLFAASRDVQRDRQSTHLSARP